MPFNSKFLIKREVLLEAARAAANEFCVFNVIRKTAGMGAEPSSVDTRLRWLLMGLASCLLGAVLEVY